MSDHTQTNNSLEEAILRNNINPSDIHNHGIPAEMARKLKELGITGLLMGNTGEMLTIDTKTHLEQENLVKHRKKTFRHRNKLGYIDPTVAGIDIGDKGIFVAIPDTKGEAFVREFRTTTPGLAEIITELKKAGVTTGVMEATGVYWIPLFEMMEESGLKPVLVDARSVKNVPGRKTDVLDCQWIQVLYSNGLLRAAFRPPRDRLPLRAYVRTRLSCVKTRQFTLTLMEKALQLMNIKLSSAVSDISSISGMNMIRAIANGERDPVKIARMRKSNCKKPEEFFVEALTGNYQKEHLFSLKIALTHYDFAEDQLKQCDEMIKAELESYPIVVRTPPPKRDKDKNLKGEFATFKKPKRNDLTFDARTLLWHKSGIDMTALPGIQASSALLIFAELGGTDVSNWRRDKEFTSWLKVCSGNNVSGGKSRRSKRQPCANYITQTLRVAAMSAKHSKSSLGAHIRRVTGRTDRPKGIKAGAHKLAKMIYHMCKEGWQYHEKGEDFYEKQYEERSLKSLEKKAKERGLKLVPIVK